MTAPAEGTHSVDRSGPGSAPHPGRHPGQPGRTGALEGARPAARPVNGPAPARPFVKLSDKVSPLGGG